MTYRSHQHTPQTSAIQTAHQRLQCFVRRALRIGALSVSLLALSWPVTGLANEAGKPVPGHLLVAPKPGLLKQDFNALAKRHHALTRKFGQSDLYLWKVPVGSEQAVAAALAHNPWIQLAELDRYLAPALIPNDNFYFLAWHLPKIGAPAAWDTTLGQDITIAIIDSGVEATHPDLAPNLVAGWNVIDNNTNTADVNSHGTRVAGTAAALTHNAQGVAGVAGNAKVMPIRVSDAQGLAALSALAEGLTWAADHGALIANMSFNGVNSSAAIGLAASYLRDKGGLLVNAAGNAGGQELQPPQANMITVSALDRNDQLASFSSYGDYVDVAAPGVDIWTTDIGGGYIGVPGGTSYASPITAGVLALMMSANPELLPQDLEQLLFASAQDLGAAGFDPQYGHGRVDAAAAVQAALNATPSQGPERVPPVVTITQPAAYSTVSDYAMVHIDATDNVGVTRVELKANDRVVAIDYVAPYELAWYTPSSPDGIVELVAYAYDEAGNVGVSTAVPVNVANPVIPPPDTDTTAPEISIVNPVEGAVSGQVNITVNATDNSGAANISLSLYIDNVLYASGSGSTLNVVWNTRPKRVQAGTHTLRVDARDAAGNPSSASVVVDVVKSRGGAKR